MPHQGLPRVARPAIAQIKWTIGCVCVLLATFLTITTELGAVRSAKTYNRIIVSVNPIEDIMHVEGRFNGSLVYITGPLKVDESLTETEYGISFPCVHLKRRVQMYQWVERKTMDKITYDCDWRDELIDSSKFIFKEGHGNPKYFPINSATYTSKTVMIGAYILGDDLKKRLGTFTTITNTQKPEKNNTKLYDGKFYHSKNVSNPQVGDIRVKFSVAGLIGEKVSVIAYQSSNQLVMNSSDPVLFMAEGTVPPETLAKNSRFMRYIRFSRALGWILFYGGGIFVKDTFMEFGRQHPSPLYRLCLNYNGSIEVLFANATLSYMMSTIWSTYSLWVGMVICLCFVNPTLMLVVCALLESLQG